MIDSKEVRRQVLHMLVGALLILFIYFEWITPWIVFGMLIGLSALSFLSTKFDIPVISSLIKKHERSYDAKTFPGRGPILMLAGILLSLKLFPIKIALASIAVLAFGDSISHLVGARFGRTKSPFNKNGPKLLEGLIAGTIVGALTAMAFVRPTEAFIGALGAMIVESVELEMNGRPVDDNIVVPLAAGAIMLIVRSYIPF